ncbi:hypothetical protein ABEB36_012216 [Hypothenemus hampei]|uniref:Uncharacterized protein n=1 Tax=Hypothenemus hampei TaxID=57062 RepID=A0ABD1EAF6_HYPHA
MTVLKKMQVYVVVLKSGTWLNREIRRNFSVQTKDEVSAVGRGPLTFKNSARITHSGLHVVRWNSSSTEKSIGYQLVKNLCGFFSSPSLGDGVVLTADDRPLEDQPSSRGCGRSRGFEMQNCHLIGKTIFREERLVVNLETFNWKRTEQIGPLIAIGRSQFVPPDCVPEIKSIKWLESLAVCVVFLTIETHQ